MPDGSVATAVSSELSVIALGFTLNEGALSVGGVWSRVLGPSSSSQIHELLSFVRSPLPATYRRSVSGLTATNVVTLPTLGTVAITASVVPSNTEMPLRM